MDTEYLKVELGTCLTQCLAEVSMKRPQDPIEFIAQWLYKSIENNKYIKQVCLNFVYIFMCWRIMNLKNMIFLLFCKIW